MKRLALGLAIVVLAFAGAGGCARAPPARAPCPIYLRLYADGMALTGNCRTQIAANVEEVGPALKELLNPGDGTIIEWIRSPSITLDIDDNVSLALAQTLLNKLQDNGFYWVEFADGPGRPAIPAKLPPMFGGPFHAVVVMVQPDQKVSLAVADLNVGTPTTALPAPSFQTIAANDLTRTLAGQVHGKAAYVGGALPTSWRDTRPIYRALAAAGCDEFVSWDPGPPPTSAPP
jgi:hypothetical protein